MARWLVKSDPDEYSFADLVRDKRTVWDGISNAAALGHLRRMKKGDDCFVYETGKIKSIVGRAKIASAPRADPRDPKLVVIDLSAGAPVARPLSLAEIKADPAFAAWELVRISRLSVMPVPEEIGRRLDRLTER